MLPSLSSGLRLALILLFGGAVVTAAVPPAYAQDDDEEDEDEDEDEDEGDDEGATEEDDEDIDKDQPAVTAGGLYTMKTYPIREIYRPLTMTQGITQMRLGLGSDVSAQGAFESYGVSLEAIHGLKDNFTLLGGFTSAYNFADFGIYGGFEGALYYDVVDIRLAARLSRPAVPATDMMGLPIAGEYNAGKVKGAVDIGFPLRYVARPEIAIIALYTLMSIDFDSKPDLNPSLGIATNPIEPISVIIFAQLQIVDFNTDAGFFTVPATARIQFSPNQKLDIGAEFKFLNVKPPEGVKFYDNRFLTLYMAARFGK